MPILTVNEKRAHDRAAGSTVSTVAEAKALTFNVGQQIIVENTNGTFIYKYVSALSPAPSGDNDAVIAVTAGGFLVNVDSNVPRLTTAQVAAIATAGGSEGATFYDTDKNKFVYIDNTSTPVEPGAGGSASWGNITGTLSDQTDLQSALDLKAPLASPTFTGTVAGITKAMVGLGNVDNTSDANKPISTATQTALDLKAPLASPTFTGTVAGITKAMVGLGNADNTADADKPISTATQTALDLKAPLASPTFTGTVAGITKAMVGLGNVDNTSDANKPISTATQTALDDKANKDSPAITGSATFADDIEVANRVIIDTPTATPTYPTGKAGGIAAWQSGGLIFYGNNSTSLPDFSFYDSNEDQIALVSKGSGVFTFTNAPRFNTSPTVGQVWTATNADGTGAWQTPASGLPTSQNADLTIGAVSSGEDIETAIPLGTGSGQIDLTSGKFQRLGLFFTITLKFDNYQYDDEVVLDFSNILDTNSYITSSQLYVDLGADGQYYDGDNYISNSLGNGFDGKTARLDRLDSLSGNSPAVCTIMGVY